MWTSCLFRSYMKPIRNNCLTVKSNRLASPARDGWCWRSEDYRERGVMPYARATLTRTARGLGFRSWPNAESPADRRSRGFRPKKVGASRPAVRTGDCLVSVGARPVVYFRDNPAFCGDPVLDGSVCSVIGGVYVRRIDGDSEAPKRLFLSRGGERRPRLKT
jgi:hypothetical protein